MSPVWRWFVIFLEIAILSALILATRCANYWDDFVAGDVYFTVACAVWWLVSLVVVAANEVSLPMGDADRLRDQHGSCARNGTWTARSSIAGHVARDGCDLCRLGFAIRIAETMERT